MMKITCVYDEGAKVHTPLIGAKGTSFAIDVDGHRVLFDTGLRDKYLITNLDILEMEPDSFDVVVISQSHPDNSRALNGFLKERSEPIDVYAPAGIFEGNRTLFSRGIALSEEARSKAVFHDILGWTDVVPGVTVSPMLPSGESFLVLGNGAAVISGRGINGPAEMLDMVQDRFGRKARTFIGSVLLEKVKKNVAAGYATDFNERGCTELYLNHCTGRDGMTNLRVSLGLKGVDDFYVGDTLDLHI